MSLVCYFSIDYFLTCQSCAVWTIIEIHNWSEISQEKAIVAFNTFFLRLTDAKRKNRERERERERKKYKHVCKSILRSQNEIDISIILFIDKRRTKKSSKFFHFLFCQNACNRTADTLIFYPISHYSFLFRIHSNNIANSIQFLLFFLFSGLTQSVTNDLLFCLSIFFFPTPLLYTVFKLPKPIITKEYTIIFLSAFVFFDFK